MPPEIKINLHPVNFVIISGILQSIILAGILLTYRSGKRRANKLIGLAVLICGLHFSWTLIIDTNLADLFKQVFWIPYSFVLAIGPLLFFYTKSLTQSGFKVHRQDLIHFIPVILEVLLQLYFIRESILQEKLFYDVHGFFGFRTAELAGTAASIFIYGKRCLALIKAHEVRMLENFSNQKDITLLWLFKLIQYVRVLWIFWLAFEISFLVFWQLQMHLIPVYLLLYILLGIIVYSNFWIGIQALVKSEHLTEKTSVSVGPENVGVYSRIGESEIQSYVSALRQVMQTEKMYLHETLTLRTLANRLQLDPNLVSYVLNNILQKSFYDYVNEFRIEEVRRKFDDPAYAHIKMIEIAFECGFNSKATFNRVFKNFTGKSPSAFKKTAE